ncbi:MAG: phage tail tape measure protein [Dehalococcoidales bacterium]|nr:phage tail tape measure protein [Dehalococcoidales bacterium]
MFNVGSATAYLKLNTAGWTGGMTAANVSVKSLTSTFTKLGSIGVGSLMLVEREFGRFDKAIRHATSVSQTSQKQFEDMSRMALDASVQWNKAATSTAQAFYYLGSAGLTVNEQMAAFNDTIMLSRAMGSELSMTVEGLVDIVRAFGLEFEDTRMIADQLTETVISSNQNFSDLDQALRYGAASARLANNTLADTAAMLGIMANAGIKGSMAGTVLRRAMTNLMSPTAEMSELMYSLGLNIYDSEGRMKPFIKLIGEISDKIAGTSDQYKNLVYEVLFGRRAISGQIMLFNYGSEAAQRYSDSIRDAGGVTREVADKQMKAFSEQLGTLWQEVRRVAIVMGGQLAPAIERVATNIRDNLETFREYVEANAEAVQSTMKWMAVIGVTLTIGGPLLLLVTSLITKFVSLAKVIASPFTVLIAALVMFRGLWEVDIEKMKSDVIALTASLNKKGEGATGSKFNWSLLKATSLGIGARALVNAPYIGYGVAATSLAYDAYKQWGNGWIGKQYQKTKWGMPRYKNTALSAMKPISSGVTGEFGEKDLGKAARDVKDDLVTTFKAGLDAIFTDLDVQMANIADMPGVGGLTDEISGAIQTLKDMFNLFMTEPVKAAEEAVEALTDPSAPMEQGSEKLVVSFTTRWKNAVQQVIDETKQWHSLFVETASNIRDEWANTIEAFINEGGKFSDFIDGMLDNILKSFNRMVAELAANRLFYSVFGSWLQDAEGGKYKPKYGVSIPGVETQPYSSTLDNGSFINDNLGMFPVPKAAIAPVSINVENTGEPVTAKVTGQQFDGRQYVVSVVLEEAHANPGFRQALGGA